MNDQAAHDILATTLLVALAVVLSGAFALVVRAQLVPELRYASDLQMTFVAGPDESWGTGDEQVRVSHSGGEGIPVEALVLMLSVEGAHTRHVAETVPSLGRSFGIGETWTVVTTIPRGASVDATLVLRSDGGSYVFDRLDVRSIA